jgi:hypothetical protein
MAVGVSEVVSTRLPFLTSKVVFFRDSSSPIPRSQILCCRLAHAKTPSAMERLPVVAAYIENILRHAATELPITGNTGRHLVYDARMTEDACDDPQSAKFIQKPVRV